MRIKYYDSSIGRIYRTEADLSDDEKIYCLKIHGSLVSHVTGAIAILDKPALWNISQESFELVQERINECLESIHECQNHGLALRLDPNDSRFLQASQGPEIGLLGAWNLRIDEGSLGYQTAENTTPLDPKWGFKIDDGNLEYQTKEDV